MNTHKSIASPAECLPEDELCTVLASLRDLLASNAERTLCESLLQRWRTRTFHLAILGQFKRGKSTLVNAFVGRAVLPTAVLPLTAIPTFLSRGRPERLLVHFLDGHTEERTISEIDHYVTEAQNPENRLGVRQVEVFLESHFPPPGVCLIDTPGIGSVLRHNTAATVNILSHCDAALFVLSPDPPITETEETFLRTVAGIVPRIIPVLAKADVLPPSELLQVIEYNRRLLAQILEDENTHLYPVAAARVLENHGNDAADSFEFARLRCDLLAFLENEREAVLRRSLSRRGQSLALQLYDVTRLELEALRMDGQTRQERLHRFLEEAARLRREQETAIDVLNADGARIIMTVNRAAPEIAQRVRAEALATLTKLLSEVQDPREIRNGLPSVKQAMSRFIEWAFTRERAQLERTIRKRVEEIAREHINKCADLVNRLVQVAGNIFALEVASTSLSEEFEFRVEDYWPVLPPPVMLGTISLGALAPILPKAWLRSYHARRIADAIEEAVRTNTERLRFSLAQATEASLVASREELLRQYDHLVQRVRGAIDAAHRTEQDGREARHARAQALQNQSALLLALAQKLQRLGEQ